MAKTVHPGGKGPDLLRILAKRDFIPTVPRDQQVASHLRELLQKQKIPAHTKLPSVRALAQLWDTNYHTIYDAMKRLSGEGLVILRPVRGSFVAPPRRMLRSVCLYHNRMPYTFGSSMEFYTHLDLDLDNRLFKRGVAVIPFYDRRAHNKLHTVPAEVRTLASEGKIDAVIATTIYPRHTPWLFQLEVPVASLMLGQPERRIEVNVSGLAQKVIDLAVKSGRKTIGLIHQPMGIEPKELQDDLLRTELERQAHAHGISVILPKPLTHYQTTHYMHWEQLGSEVCEQLLDAAAPPDLIFVYPDSYIRGVAIALVKHRIQIPGKILVVSHRNEETDIYVPFPMTWITVKIGDFVDALIDQIDRQIAGKKLTATSIALKIKETAPFHAPS